MEHWWVCSQCPTQFWSEDIRQTLPLLPGSGHEDVGDYDDGDDGGDDDDDDDGGDDGDDGYDGDDHDHDHDDHLTHDADDIFAGHTCGGCCTCETLTRQFGKTSIS